MLKNAVIDGEIVCLDENGVSQFNWLLSGRRADQAILYVFDLLWINEVDLRRTPFIFRRIEVTLSTTHCRRSALPRDSTGRQNGKDVAGFLKRPSGARSPPLTEQIGALNGRGRKPGWKMSAAARRKISLAQKKRWRSGKANRLAVRTSHPRLAAFSPSLPYLPPDTQQSF